MTVDVEEPLDEDCCLQDWMDFYEEISGDFFPSDVYPSSIEESDLPRCNSLMLSNAITSAVAPRDVKFVPMFSFIYKDGHRMLSFGGMIGSDSERRSVLASPVIDTSYFRGTLRKKPFEILIPQLTRRERHHLDAAMPCSKTWTPSFEMKRSEINAYKEIYRFIPSYAELLL